MDWRSYPSILFLTDRLLVSLIHIKGHSHFVILTILCVVDVLFNEC